MGKLIIFSAPSGSGKSTIINRLMQRPELHLAFSISCTSRAPRGTEQNGVEYFFITPEEFRERISRDEFLEYEEVYQDRFYGTLKEQVETQAARGENVVAVYINNAIYGMTGGQMAPTTLLGMKTATTPYGRDPRLNGYPYKIAEMMAHLDGTAYITRQSVHTPANVRKCKRALRKAFETAMAGKGFSLVEVVSTCNSGWKMSPVAANEWLAQNMLPYYPLGDIKSNE